MAGAIFSGLRDGGSRCSSRARRIFDLDNVVTERHLDNLGKMILVTGWIVIYSYIIEDFHRLVQRLALRELPVLRARARSGQNSGVFWAQHVLQRRSCRSSSGRDASARSPVCALRSSRSS